MNVAATLDPALGLSLRAALAVLFAAAVVHKLRAPGAFARVVAAYDLFPHRLANAAAASVIAVETGTAVLLLSPATNAGPLLAASLLILYGAAIATNLVRGRSEIDCGCSVARRAAPLAWSLVARNAFLTAVALVAALPSGARALAWIDAVTVAGAALALSVVYHAADTLLANRAGLLVFAARAAEEPRAPRALGGRRWSRL